MVSLHTSAGQGGHRSRQGTHGGGLESRQDLRHASGTKEGGRVPHFLWNCKMRFGKTFTTYQLALRMGWTRVLVLTFKPAVVHAWEEDLMTHVDFDGWQFIARSPEATIDYQFQHADMSKPMVVFGSFQDFLGKNTASGGMKLKHEWAREFNWDCIVLDEYHYGAWRENPSRRITISTCRGLLSAP